MGARSSRAPFRTNGLPARGSVAGAHGAAAFAL